MTVLSSLMHDTSTGKMWRALFASFIMTALKIPYCLTLATLIFSGPLRPYVLHGAGMMLFGCMVLGLLIGLTSSYRGAHAGPQEIPAAALGTMGVTVAANMANAPGEAAFMTITALLIISSAITSLVFLGIGLSRQSNTLRFIPFPVTAGCFAGFGLILCTSAFSMMSSIPLDWQTLPRLFDPAVIWKWTPGIAYAVFLLLAMRRGNSVAFLIWSFMLLTGVFHLILFVFDISIEYAQSTDLLWSGIGESGLWPAFGLSDFSLVDWGVVEGQIPMLLVVTLIMVLCMLLNMSVLEEDAGKEIDLDREFRIAGVAGIFAGAGGSSPGMHATILSVASRKLGADTPWTGIFSSFWLCMLLFFGSAVLELIPISLIGGLLFFFGTGLLRSGLLKVRRKLSWSDYGISVLIGLSIVVFGFVEGVAIGMLASLGLLIVTLVRLDPVEAILNGTDNHSNKARSVPDRAILLAYGERIKIVRLRGYIYFGVIYRLIGHLKNLLSDAPAPRFIVLNCSKVLGFDASAINVICLFLKSAQLNDVRVVFVSPPARFMSSVIQDLPGLVRDRVWFDKDMDHALERCEDFCISAATQQLDRPSENEMTELLKRVGDKLEDQLDRQIQFEKLIELLEPWMERCEYKAGEMLAEQGNTHNGMQLVVGGRVSVYDKLGSRLFQYGPSNVVEPKAAFGVCRPFSTTVAEEPCVTMMLTPDKRSLLESEKPDLSIMLYKFMLTDHSWNHPS